MTATHNSTAAERRAIEAMGIRLPPDRPRADPAPRSRRPLGLRPAPGGDDDERAPGAARRDIGERVDSLVRTAIEGLGGEERCRATHSTLIDQFDGLAVSLRIALEGDDDLYRELHGKIIELETEIAKLTAQVAVAQSKLGELIFISERLRVENAGPIGPQGLMGRDGRDGPPGLKGERGAKGDQGPRPVAFAVNDAEYSVTLIMSDGGPGPTLHLRSLFETFNDAINDADDAAEHDAAAARREAEARRLGL